GRPGAARAGRARGAAGRAGRRTADGGVRGGRGPGSISRCRHGVALPPDGQVVAACGPTTAPVRPPSRARPARGRPAGAARAVGRAVVTRPCRGSAPGAPAGRRCAPQGRVPRGWVPQGPGAAEDACSRTLAGGLSLAALRLLLGDRLADLVHVQLAG